MGGKSMKVLASAAALAVAALMVSGGAFAQDKPTLAFVANGASDFWKAAEAGMKKAQGELPDYTLEFKYPDQSSVANQQALMDNLATAGVKAIMVSAVDPKATDVLDKIAGETALFTTDSDAPNSKRIAYIGSSNVDAGKQAAEIAKKAMPNGATTRSARRASPKVSRAPISRSLTPRATASTRPGPRPTSPTCWPPTPTSTAWSASTPTTRPASMRR
jgi:ABC-type sugar transport system substrate-binding protein